VFRYAHQYDRAIALVASGKVGRKPPVLATLPFANAIAALDRLVEARPTDVKIQISLR
jgi:D-xylulose reductase